MPDLPPEVGPGDPRGQTGSNHFGPYPIGLLPMWAEPINLGLTFELDARASVRTHLLRTCSGSSSQRLGRLSGLASLSRHQQQTHATTDPEKKSSERYRRRCSPLFPTPTPIDLRSERERERGSSVIGDRELFMSDVSDEEGVVDEGGDGGADEGAEPVDPVVVPGPADDGGAEGDGGVHGRAVEGSAGEDVGADDEADGDGSDDSEVPLLRVNGCRVDGVDQPEGHHDLEHQRVPRGHIRRQSERPSFLPNKKTKVRRKAKDRVLLLLFLLCGGYQAAGGELEEEAGDDGTEQLGDPVEEAPEQGDVAAEECAEGDGGIDVAAGDVGPHGDGHEQREGVRQRRRYQSGRRRRSVAGELVCDVTQPV